MDTNIAESLNNTLAEVQALVAENTELRESNAQIRTMFSQEDAGWVAILGMAAGDREDGLDLDEVKSISEKARTKVAAASLEKRAAELHGGYVFGKGLDIDNTVRDPEDNSKRGAVKKTIRVFEKTVNQESVFSDGAKKELQRARFTDGNVIVICDTRDLSVRRIPLKEITGFITHPDFNEDIIAWKRTWDQVQADGKSKTKSEWIYSNRFEGERAEFIDEGNDVRTPVRENATTVDLRANRQVGWALGIPDATAGMHWTQAYGEVLRYGQVVSEGLAKVIFKVTNKSEKGAKSVGVKMGSFNGTAGTAALGEGQDISLVNATQRSFDFTAARPLAAMAASAWSVPNIDLLSDSSAAGSSYGAAAALTEGVRNAMVGMQNEWTQFYQDIFFVLTGERPKLHWPPMETPDIYRQAQALTLYSVALTDQEYRARALDDLDIPGDPNKIPPTLKARSKTDKQAASPDQGKNSDAGSADSTSKGDTRTDGIEALRREMALDDLITRLAPLLEKLESM